MIISLPRIQGTAHDSARNGLIDSVNDQTDPHQPKLAAHAVAAISKLLTENHELAGGGPWLQESIPLVHDMVIFDPMVDSLYDRLVKAAKPSRGFFSRH